MITQRNVFLVAGLAAAVLLLSDVARAQDSSADETARSAFKEAEAHYAAGRYQKAADLFQEAYDLSKKPELLYNLGNSYERMGKFGKAAEYLRQYAASPDARAIDLVHERIGRLEAASERRAQELTDLKEQRTVGVVQQADRLAKRRRAKITGWVLLGSGVALLGTALTFGILSMKAGDDAAAGCAGGLCLDSVRGDLDDEKNFGLVSDITLGVGVVAAGVGTYLVVSNWLKDRRDRKIRETASLHLLPTVLPGGGAATLIGRF